mgnify:CR=1 FL=1
MANQLPKAMTVQRIGRFLAGAALAALLAGCGDSAQKQVLETDANGFQCEACKAKFYTDADTFANHCPQCKQPQVQQVVGFVCPADQHVTVAPRSRGSVRCEKCGKPVSGLCIPKAKDLQAWGAARKTAAEVGSR